MVANEIGQVDVFSTVVGDDFRSRWMASSVATPLLRSTTAQTPTTAAPPGGAETKPSLSDQGWAVLSGNGLLETEENGRHRPGSPSSSTLLDLYYSSVCRYVDEDVEDEAVSVDESVEEEEDEDSECNKDEDSSDPSESNSSNESTTIHLEVPAQQDAPDNMPQHHPECCDTGGGESLPPASTVALKSALKRPTGRSLLRKKLRVKFNEALNTFLECDYVIYVDDDEYDLLYHLAAAEQQHQLELQHQQQLQQQQQPQLVNVRSFELQLPETSSSTYSSSQVELTGSTPSSSTSTSSGDPVTLSPPDGYKDAAALYAAALVVQLNQQGDGEHWAEEGYYEEETIADEAESTDPAVNGWEPEEEEEATSPQQNESSPQEQSPLPPVPEPDPPRTGILKGGKFWKGAANNGAGNITTTTTSDELNSGAGGTETSKENKPAAAVRFIQLNDADLEEDQGKAGSHHSSAFQQLFPRARKLLLQDLPEAEIQRLTTNARVNAAVSSTSSFSRSALAGNNNTTSSTLHLSSNDDLKYEKALRVTEAEEADHYKTLPSVTRRVEATARQHQRRTDPPTSTESLVERLKWLTTTEDQEETEGVDDIREAADGVSDPEASQQPSSAVDDYASLAEITAVAGSIETSNSAPYLTVAGASATSAAQEVQDSEVKPSKSGAEKSTYRKLNELFFRSKGSKEKGAKDKSGSSLSNNEQWKTSSTSSLNRSFSPPPPAEVEPKMKPSKKPHLIHIVGLTPGSTKSGTTMRQGETLGRIPNVVPTVDHVYRAAVDLVTRNSAAAAAAAAAGFTRPLNEMAPHATNSYTLDDIDAALRAQMVMGASGVGGSVAEAVSFLQAQDLRDETSGGSRSSGSSGDSGLGSSSLDTSLGSGNSDPSSGQQQDELQAFVRQDATQGRIDRIKKRYSAALEDEAEDYGFLRRPSVRGIKTRFGSTSEIIQQMQAQLAPPQQQQQQQQPPQQQHYQLQQHVKTQSMGSWTYAEDVHHQGSMQTQALLDPREKRRSALVMSTAQSSAMGMMSNSVHLPALPEDGAFYQSSTAATAAAGVIRAGYHHQQQQQHLMVSSRPASAMGMNIYGSTGDLYQHLRAPVRPVIVHHPQPVQSSAHPVPHILERTSSVSSALDVGVVSTSSGIYGTIRRQPIPQQQQQQSVYSGDPHQMYASTMMHPAQQQQQQIPLRMSISQPGGYMANPIQQQQTFRPAAGYLPAQDYSSSPTYATLPTKRATPYGVPMPGMVDPTRYRQVLPPVVSSQLVALRPNGRSVPVVATAPPTATTSSSSSKDEREGPEGASSSPGLTMTSDVCM